MGALAVKAFFFAPESPRPLALMRMAVGLIFLYDAAARWPYAVELYSSDGSPMPLFPQTAYSGTFFEPVAVGAAWTVVLHSLLLFALLTVTLGWRTRTSLWIAVALTVWMGLLDHAGTFKKYSVIGMHLMVLLSFSGCGAVWSIDRLLRSKGRLFVMLSPAWPRRLIQLLFVSIYFGAALTKIRLPDFANGDLLMFSLLDDQWGGGRWGLWFSTQPRLLILASIATVLFELAFPLLVWSSRLRLPMLVLAALFHIVLGVTMSLGIFSPVMLAALLAFISERDLSRGRALAIRFSRAESWTDFAAVNRTDCDLSHPNGRAARFRRRPVLRSRVLYLLIGGLWVAGGWAIQRVSDPYGVFGTPMPTEFHQMDEATVEKILADRSLSYQDYFHRIEIGSRLSSDGTHAFGERKRFQRGMTLFACARLIQKHPALDLEWLLIRSDGEEAHYSHRLDGASSHATVGFALTDAEQTPPGRYQLVLRAAASLLLEANQDDIEIWSRSFELVE